MKIVLFLLLLFPTALTAQDLKVVDGDTIHIGKTKYRFHGIDAPEMSQVCMKDNKNIKCGVVAKDKLLEKIGSQKGNLQTRSNR
jgi:endonuclease YncB( thermonuclease family)